MINNRVPIIEVEKLSKIYDLSHSGSNTLLRDEVSTFLSGKKRKLSKNKSEKFNALDNINFKVYEGEVIGVIGANGAGKSTLLKILSRITYPTSGKVVLRGRVASLLEVGTGFNPELTGLENIYLNGAILGMNRKEINSKLDAIIQFADVGKFIDIPVKKYSSGMYIRLAFSIAAHLESEILLIDEVLAVGDAKFQKRCLGKVDEVTKSGNRTVIFVSHDLNAITRLCKRTFLFKNGKIIFDGQTGLAIKRYMSEVNKGVGKSISNFKNLKREGTHEIFIKKIELIDKNNRKIRKITSTDPLSVRIYFGLKKDCQVNEVLAGFLVKTELGEHIFLQHNVLEGVDFGLIKKTGYFEVKFNNLPLAPGNYLLNCSILKNNGLGGVYYDNINDAVSFEVVHSNFFMTGLMPSPEHGHTLVRGKWKVNYENNK